jgi:formylglycine-generating enzyme
VFPWGDELEPGGEHRMNVWQGAFPAENTCADGFYGTCPVGAYPANGSGLHNMTGNVWEWCADWYSPDVHTRDRRTNPQGPPRSTNRSACRCWYSNRTRRRVRAQADGRPRPLADSQ